MLIPYLTINGPWNQRAAINHSESAAFAAPAAWANIEIRGLKKPRLRVSFFSRVTGI
jgi:hypothetical protein